jgi:enediyne biosynthesis protein E3
MVTALRSFVFGISPEEATFARRGFRVGENQTRKRLEQIGKTFLVGYHAALRQNDADALAHELQWIDPELNGFAFEGAAMALTLLDHLMPWRMATAGPRLQTFLTGPGEAHRYMIHVGAGWALARLPWRTAWPPRWLDPLLGWLAVDGYGFHEGYFHWRRSVNQQVTPRGLTGYACRVFDQGLGRSLWFVEGADVIQISQTIAAFPAQRHADLWSGVGLACAYAGGVNTTQIAALRTAAGAFQPCLAQGAAFAAKARRHAGNPDPHTELACTLLCGLSADQAAGVTDQALIALSTDEADAHQRLPAYEIWRQRIQAQLPGHHGQQALMV